MTEFLHSMNGFYLVCAALGVLVMLGIFLGVPRRHNATEPLNVKALFAEKLQLLVHARDSGELSDEDFAIAAAELKQQTLDAGFLDTSLGNSSRHSKLLALLVVLVFTVAFYLWKGQYRELAQWYDAQTQLQDLGKRALLGQGEQLSEQELNLFALGLRTKLASSGDDAVGWFVLGRIWFAQGRVDDAIDAFEKALQLTPERANLLLSFAQALLTRGSEDDVQRAAGLLGVVMKNDPANTDALAMLALIAQQRGDLVEARTAWELLATQIPVDDPRHQSIQQQLAALDEQAKPKPALAQTPAVRVHLTVPVTVAQLYPQATVFVFAKAADGPPMPLAVQKMAMFSGEQVIELTNQMRMTPQFGLAEAGKVVISARISKTGSSNPDPTDPTVSSAVLELGTDWQEVTLTF